MERRRADLIADRIIADLETRLTDELVVLPQDFFDSFLKDRWADIVSLAAIEELDPPPIFVTRYH